MTETINNIWNVLIMPNELGIKFVSFLGFIESYVTMLLFTTILNVSTTRKQRLSYVLIFSITGILAKLFIPMPYSTFLCLLVNFLSIHFILKIPAMKSIIALIIPLILTVLCESILSKVFVIVFDMTYEYASTIPIYRIVFMLLIYAIIYITYRLCKKSNINITILDDIDKKSKKTLISMFLLFFVALCMQLYLIYFYSDTLPTVITLISMLVLIAYFYISFYSLSKTMKLAKALEDKETLELYNHTLNKLHDDIRAFKHDFNNIVQAIGGYVASNDINGLAIYYKDLLEDCQTVNNLTTLSPEVINNPSVHNLLASKYHLADEKGIKINLDIFLDINKLNITVYDLTRILGILLDNAIEAAEECEKRIVNIEFKIDPLRHRQLIIIENTFKNKDVNIEAIYKKTHTSKENHSGFGLWEVRQMLKRNNNLNLYTTKNNEFFIQQLEIYDIVN